MTRLLDRARLRRLRERAARGFARVRLRLDVLLRRQEPLVTISRVRSFFSTDQAPPLSGFSRTAQEALDRYGRGLYRIVWRDGRRLRPWELLRDGDRLVMTRGIPGDVISIIIFVVVTALINFAVSYLLNLLLGPKSPSKGSAGGSPTYNWTGIVNTTTQGSPIPIVYGEHRIGSTLIQVYRRNLTEYATGPGGDLTQYLYITIGLGWGPLTAIGSHVRDTDSMSVPNLPTGIHINGNDANTFSDIVGHIRMGTAGQAVLPTGFDKPIQSYTPDLHVPDTTWVEYGFKSVGYGAHLNVEFSGGLFDQTGGEGIENRTVVLEWEASIDGGTIWSATATVTVTEARVTPFSITILDESRADPPVQIRYRIRRTTTESNDNRIGDRVRLKDINEIVGLAGVETYPEIGLLALRIKATDQLSGGRPNITSIVKGVEVPVYQTATGSELPVLKRQYSANPAWVALDLLLNKRYGTGNQVELAEIDIESFQAWAAWCDEVLVYSEQLGRPILFDTDTESVRAGVSTVYLQDTSFPAGSYVRVENEGINVVLTDTDLGGGRHELVLMLPIAQAYPAGWTLWKITLDTPISDTRCEYNGVFDSDGKAWSVLRQICQVGRGVPVLFGNRIRVRYEDQSPRTQIFNEANIVKDSLELNYADGNTSDFVTIQFLDAADEYDQAIAEPQGGAPVGLTRSPIKKSINLYGCTSAPLARREAEYHTRSERLIRTRATWSSPPEGISAEAGDIVGLGLVLTDWAEVVGRASGTLQSFKLSHELVVASNFITYKALFRRASAPEGTLVEITSGAGTYAPGDLITTDSDDASPIDEAPVLIGRENTHVLARDFRILTMELDPKDLVVKIEAVEHVPEVYGLGGWPHGEIIIPNGGPTPQCSGTFAVPLPAFNLWCDDGYDPDPCDCRLEIGSVTVTITSTPPGLADCATLVSVTPTHVTITVTPECGTGEICIGLSGSAGWVCCEDAGPDPCCIPLDLPDGCAFDFEVCMECA